VRAAVLAVLFSVVAAIVYDALPRIALGFARLASKLTPRPLRDQVDPYADVLDALSAIEVGGETRFSVFRMAVSALLVATPRLLAIDLLVRIHSARLLRTARLELRRSAPSSCESAKQLLIETGSETPRVSTPVTPALDGKTYISKLGREEEPEKAGPEVRRLTAAGSAIARLIAVCTLPTIRMERTPFKERIATLLSPVPRWLMTATATTLAVMGALLICAGMLGTAAYSLTIAMTVEVLDSLTAPGRASRRGILWYILSDRIIDISTLTAIAWWLHSRDPLLAGVCVLTGVLDLLGSYVRTTAMSLGLGHSHKAKVGRAERLFVVTLAVWLGAFGAFVTMRIVLVVALLVTTIIMIEGLRFVLRDASDGSIGISTGSMAG